MRFPIPIRATGTEVLFKPSRNPNGTLVCSIHVPLANSVLRYLTDLGLTPAAVVARMQEQEFPIWGTSQGIPVLIPGSNVLLKVKKILRQGGTVAAMADAAPGSPLNPNMFYLIKHVGAEVVFAVSELQPNGEILLQFSTPPDPFCKTEESIKANLEALDDLRQCIWNPSPRRVAAEDISLRSSASDNPTSSC